MLFYHIGLNLTVVMLIIRGVVQVLSLDVSSAVLSEIAGIGHLILGISMVLVLISIRNCIKDSFLTISHNLMNVLYIKRILHFKFSFC